MSSIFKNLKSLFVVEEEGAGASKPADIVPDKPSKPSGAGKDSPPVITEDFVPSVPAVGTGELNEKFLDILLKALEQNNLQGFDYLEFRQSLQSLRKMPMDEATRFQSAFAVAQTLGATPDKLAQSAGHYLNILNQEENKFEQALEKQQKERITGRGQDLEQMSATIQQKQAQIAQLNKEIEAHQQEMEKMKAEIQETTSKVETTRRDFVTAYQHLAAQIQGDVENIKKYLK